MSGIKRWLTRLAVVLLEHERDDERRLARERMLFGRWLRVMKRKEETGRGVIRVDREGIAYLPQKRVVLKAKH